MQSMVVGPRGRNGLLVARRVATAPRPERDLALTPDHNMEAETAMEFMRRFGSVLSVTALWIVSGCRSLIGRIAARVVIMVQEEELGTTSQLGMVERSARETEWRLNCATLKIAQVQFTIENNCVQCKLLILFIAALKCGLNIIYLLFFL